jgi:predicted AAA+ superfamily ATPase
MIARDLEPYLLKDAQKAPVIAIFGPRQSGKTTLARATFKNHTYISFEDIDVRNFALSDPRGFLKEYR